MLLDEGLRATLRNFSTLFLLAAVVTVPLHVIHGYVFRDVIAVRELAPAIEHFPPAGMVRGVGQERLDAARRVALGLTLVELALLPLAAGAAAAVAAMEQRGRPPTVLGALASAFGVPGAVAALRRAPGPLLAATLIAGACYLLAHALAVLLSEPVPDERAFALAGLLEGAARALAATFFLGVAGWVGARGPGLVRSKDT